MAEGAAALIARIAFVEMSEKMGGVQFSTLYLSERLRGLQWEPVVITPAEGDLPRECRIRQIPVRVVPQPRLISTSLLLGRWAIPNPFAWVINALLFLIIAIRLRRVLLAEQVSLVCTKGLFAHFYGGLAARWAGLSCVWHVQDLLSGRAGVLYPWLLGRAGRLLARHVIADGGPIADQLSSFYPSDLITVIHNGVDLERFSPLVSGQKVRAEWGIGEDQLLIGNVARLTRWKGQHHLLEAFALLATDFPQAVLCLVGAPIFDTADYEQELRARVTHLGLSKRVLFPGYRWDLPEVLGAIDVFVHPAVEKDTCPLGVVSAMAAGKPIVATRVSGVKELFPGGDEAVLCAPGEPRSLANALRQVLGSAVQRVALGRAARLRAEHALSLEEFARQCTLVFDQALSGR